MYKVIAMLKGLSPHIQRRYIDTPKNDKEQHDDYERRTWRERMHYDEEGNVFIPPLMLKNMLSEAAKYLSVQIKGKGKSTYTKHFEAGVMVFDACPLGVHKDEVEGMWLAVPSDGRRGGTKRVPKCFPRIYPWTVTAEFVIMDETITPEIFREHLVAGGNFIGLGSLRPRNNSFNGRFEVVEFEVLK